MHSFIGNKTIDTCDPSREHASDEEFDVWIEEHLVAEQAYVDQQIQGGDAFVLSTLGKVHTLDCRNSGFTVSRREAWQSMIPGGSRQHWREQLAHGSPPRMTAFVNRSEIAASTRKYTRCQICVPDIPEYVARSRSPRSLARVREQMEVSVSRYKAKPAKALLAVLDLHADKDGLCLGCREEYPCQTVETVATAFNIVG